MDDVEIKMRFIDELQKQLDCELDSRETFPPEIRKQIIETYKQMYKEKLDWLNKIEKGNELP